ncbi:unnamed protein product [Ceutorhynchus assimilis]|uniref:CHK kinase-like domain-containing protein n=1 Tax=Ceutorhynchus assimilis TaxID=467358 RepID=A0A9N9MKS7_9CUCU|nr:unnamed protein product [Ceutorhynchus assimilis]
MFKRFKENTTEIKNLEELLRPKFPNCKILKHDVTPLTELGENFGSEILKIDITIEENGSEKVIPSVGKMIPPTEFQMEIFNTQQTFKNEIGFYAEIVPTLQEFQRENGIEVAEYFSKFYAARLSLDPKSEVVDLDAILIMENLKVDGFGNIDRHKGFDLDMTKKVLSTLANFQATLVALRTKKPELFNSKVKPHLTEWQGIPPVADIDPILRENPRTAALIPRVKRLLSKNKLKKFTETWATITHNDFWVNNIMIKESNGKFEGLKLIDFQVIDYGSPLIDVLFFLFDSVQVSVLQYHFDKLLKYFYNEFIEVLQGFKIDTSEFTEESFQIEVNQQAPREVHHSLGMLQIILAPKGPPKIPGKINMPSDQNPSDSNGNVTSPIPFTVPVAMKDKIWFMVEEAAKRNWI